MTSSMQVMTGCDEWWCLVRMVLGARPELKFAFSGAKCKTSSKKSNSNQINIRCTMASKRTSVAFDDFSATYCRGKFITWLQIIFI